MSDAKLDQIKMNKRKRRRFTNSFYNAENLVENQEEQISCLGYFELKDKKQLQVFLNTMLKPEIQISNVHNPSNQSSNEKRYGANTMGLNTMTGFCQNTGPST